MNHVWRGTELREHLETPRNQPLGLRNTTSIISILRPAGILYEQNLQPADAMVCYKKAVELSRNIDGEGYYDPIAKLQVWNFLVFS